ncbi:MAG TPA: acyl-CoA dehydrogenase [Solirubrobacteraceae bacterium]|nr:acyl-CoA dehydrogenase [Solirubrobacteraceae bacterium]
MNFDLSDDQRDIKRTAREFLAARYRWPEVRRLALEEERAFTDAQWDEMVELGWTGAGDLGVVELAVLAEELGYALAPTPLQSTWAAARLLAAAGEEGRLAGGRRGAVAHWEPGLRDPEAPASPFAGGRLSGVKVAVPDAAVADVLVVTAEGGRHVVVEAGAPGMTISRAETLDTTRRLYEVRFDGTPAEELSGHGFEQAWLGVTAASAAESVGVAQRAMEMAVAYAKDRTQFGRPIGSYQAVSHACAQMLLEVEGARAATYWAAWALDHEPETALVAVSMAKAYAADAGRRVCGAALQVHGGIGFTWEHDLHFLLKRAHANARMYGDAAWHRGRVAALSL